jgi:p-cumate 2,3-dioxygenase ferredoxin reductase subunit
MLHDTDAPLAYIKRAGDWDELKVRLETGGGVIDCDAGRCMLSTVDGRGFPYDRFLVATGTRALHLAALENSGLDVQHLCNVEDALPFRQPIQDESRIVIARGGVIELEAACAAAKDGCSVIVIESEPRLRARAFAAIVSDLVASRHRSHGVHFVFGATVAGSTPEGVEPAATVADRGLPCSGGIAVDVCGRTAAPDVFCTGDAALQWSRCHGRAIRVETWANAQNHAITVADNMIEEAKEYSAPPWFWTDQVAGNMREADHILRGDAASAKFSVIAMRGAELVGALSVNAAKDMACCGGSSLRASVRLAPILNRLPMIFGPP